jgi:putative methionine-R-sulfoxide reductase with GAF domain
MKAARCPRGFLHQSRAQAVHWLRRAEIVARAFASEVPSLEVACGQALTAESFRTRSTQIVQEVTCWECAKLSGRIKPYG